MSTVPQKLRHHSGLFALSTATRSPWPTPNSPSRRLTELAFRMKSVNVMRSSPWTMKVFSPWDWPNAATTRRSLKRSL